MVPLAFHWFCCCFGSGFRANGSANIPWVLLLFGHRFQSPEFCWHFIGSAIVLVQVSEPMVLLTFHLFCYCLAQVSEPMVLLAFPWFCNCFGTGFRANCSASISLVLLLFWHKFLAFHWFCYYFGTGFRANGLASISLVLLLFWHRFQSQWFC